MTKKATLLTLITLIGLVFVTSCRNGKKNPPLIELSETEIITLPKQVVEVKVTFERGDRQIKKLKINGLDDVTLEKDDIDQKKDNTYTYKGWVPDDSIASVINVTFTAIDMRDNESTADLKIIVETPFSRWGNSRVISNANGSSPSAWDLVNHKSKFFIDPNNTKDIKDNTSAISGSFSSGGWTSGNSTKFVVADTTTFSYKKASIENTILAYEAGEPTSNLNNNDLSVDNVIIAKLRGEEDYAVIKIEEVYDDGANGGTGNNDDYRKFSYKKQ